MIPKSSLDDRTFNDIVDEALRLIPRYCSEWTNHNPSDPGITLIELFAWMTEMTLYRLNKVPEKTYLSLLELMGLSLVPPQSARAEGGRSLFRLLRELSFCGYQSRRLCRPVWRVVCLRWGSACMSVAWLTRKTPGPSLGNTGLSLCEPQVRRPRRFAPAESLQSRFPGVPVVCRHSATDFHAPAL